MTILPTAETAMLRLRRAYHEKICSSILGCRSGSTVFSNADSSSAVSVDLAYRIAGKLGFACSPTPSVGQAAGALFVLYTKEYLEAAFSLLDSLRPGKWHFSTSQARAGIAQFEQYEHLAELSRVLEAHKDLKAALGGDYVITPDITVSRSPLTDVQINSVALPDAPPIIAAEDNLASQTPLRVQNRTKIALILHASISCKWTMRSDRAQNSRTEALNLIRSRKGKAPQIAVVTFEPLPSRLASIAMGTGDIDCTYHSALPELMEAVREGGYLDATDMLETLVGGRRLRDISDLPFDLAS